MGLVPQIDAEPVPNGGYGSISSGIFIYVKSSEMMGGLIITIEAALQWAATYLELPKVWGQFTSPLHGHEGPSFLR